MKLQFWPVKQISTLFLVSLSVASYTQNSNNKNLKNSEYTLSASDTAVMNVDTAQVNWDTRPVQPHSVEWSYNGLPLSIIVQDAEGNFADDYWKAIDYSQNLEDLSFGQSGDIFHTQLPLNMPEDTFRVVYMAPDTAGGESGIVAVVDGFVNRYKTDMTISYMANGQPFTLEFELSNDAVKYVFGWPQVTQIPFFNNYGFDPATQPEEFENAMINLGEIFTNPDYELMAARAEDLNTPSPWQPTWGPTQNLIVSLSIEPLVQDDLYPDGLNVSMTDFGKSFTSTGTYPSYEPEEKNTEATNEDGITLTPPFPDGVTIPANMWAEPSGTWGYGHRYTAAVDPETKPEAEVTTSSGIEADVIIKPTANPLEYRITTIYKTKDTVSQETANVIVSLVPVGEKENPLPAQNTDISQNYPNPFTNSTTIAYELNDNRDMNIDIYNMQGQLVRQLYNGSQGPGKHTFSWDGTDDSGSNLPQGMYFMNITSQGYKPQNLKIMKGPD